MSALRTFIRSVRSDFARERFTRWQGSPVRRVFVVLLAEQMPASDRRADELYLDDVYQCDLYVGLFGSGYGVGIEVGLSLTEQEFQRATAGGGHRLIFVGRTVDCVRFPKVRSLIGMAQVGLIPKQFHTPEDPVSRVYRQHLAEGMIEYTVQDNPRVRLQRYRLTAKGMDAVATLNQRSTEP